MKIGIRREDKSPWETRSPLVPHHITDLVAQNIPIAVQPSEQRIFTEAELAAAGAIMTEDLSDCGAVLGVKEMPLDTFLPGRLYAFFSHTIKGQPYNMPMLRQLMKQGCHLLDYECIVDENDRRLVFFGVHAGIAGMIDALWTVGQRAAALGVRTPLAEVKQALHYASVAEAEEDIRRMATTCRKDEAFSALGPVVIGVAGYGRVAQGAQQVAAQLDPIVITPEELVRGEAADPRRFYVVEFKEEHMVRPIDEASAFDLSTYYDHPEKYAGQFSQYLEHLTLLVNCIYWEPRYPRLFTREDLRTLYANDQPKLLAIGDISCDIEGSIEITVKPTDPGDPVYVFDVGTMKPQSGFQGRGPAIMAVDILPTELPRDASTAFSEALYPLIPGLARSDPGTSFEAWDLPAPLKKAVILFRGTLTPRFAHLARYLEG